MATIAAEGEIS